jgi:hypothetical protein
MRQSCIADKVVLEALQAAFFMGELKKVKFLLSI